MVSPNDPPIWRMNELSPAASASSARGTNVRAAVMSGMKRHAKPKPVTMRGTMMSADPLSRVMWESS